MRFLFETISILNAIKFHFKVSYDSKILNLWSFHMKFMKLADGLFHKFYIKLPLNLWSFHMKFMKLAEGLFHKFYIKLPHV